MNAEEVMKTQLESWGEGRELYNVSEEEFNILRNSVGVTMEKVDFDNGDGTFYNVLLLHGYRFVCVSEAKLATQQI